MKIRNGFVSNSSSSSFIISNKHFSSVRELATYMINEKIKSERYNYDDEDDFLDNSNELCISRLLNVDENCPISFDTSEYETYIKKVSDVFLVSTCNNINWNLDDYDTRLTESAIVELKNIQSSLDEKSRDYHRISNILETSYDFDLYGIDFYNLNNMIVGVETYDSCNKCDSYIWYTKKHGKICLKCDQKHKREEKLNKINKNEN